MFKKKFIFELQRFAEIHNTKSNTLLTGTSGNDTILNGGYRRDNIWQGGGENVSISGDKGNDYTYNVDLKASLFGGAGNNSLNGGKGDDNFGAAQGRIFLSVTTATVISTVPITSSSRSAWGKSSFKTPRINMWKLSTLQETQWRNTIQINKSINF